MDIDDPEQYLKSVPLAIRLPKKRLVDAGFRFSATFNKVADDDVDDLLYDVDSEREPTLEEGAWFCWVGPTNAWVGALVVTVNQQTEDPDSPTAYVAVTDGAGRFLASYKEDLTFAEAADEAIELVLKLRQNELEIVGHKIMKKFSEGAHKKGCTCGFCKNMGKGFGKKADKDEPEKEAADESRAAKLVNKLLE